MRRMILVRSENIYGGQLRSRGLNKKHLKALELLKNTELPVTEVAKRAGINKDHLYDLIFGDAKAGPVGQEFSQQAQKVEEDQQKRIRTACMKLKEDCVSLLQREVTNDYKNKKLAKDKRKSLIDTVKALSSGQPTYNIGSVSYSKGLSPEDMVNEFKRLNAIACAALDTRGIRGAGVEGSGILLAPLGRGDKDEKAEEAASLLPESEAGAVS